LVLAACCCVNEGLGGSIMAGFSVSTGLLNEGPALPVLFAKGFVPPPLNREELFFSSR
jgi:hypothetical protein